MRVDLGKGRWAELVDVDDMTHGVKMKVQALLPTDGDTEHVFVRQLKMRELMIAHLITSWSLDQSPPKGDPGALADVPGSAYDRLVEATEPHWDSLDFLRTGSNSSESETSSEDTTSPGSSPDPEL